MTPEIGTGIGLAVGAIALAFARAFFNWLDAKNEKKKQTFIAKDAPDRRAAILKRVQDRRAKRNL